MAKLIYKLTDPDTLRYLKEANEITFDIDDDLTIDEFKIICIRLAAALGYGQKSIKTAFGEIKDGTHNIKDLINQLKNTNG